MIFMARRILTAFGPLCACAVLLAGLHGHWNFADAAVGAMGALLGGEVAAQLAELRFTDKEGGKAEQTS